MTPILMTRVVKKVAMMYQYACRVKRFLMKMMVRMVMVKLLESTDLQGIQGLDKVDALAQALTEVQWY